MARPLPSPKPRRVLGVAEVRVPGMAGDESIRRWRGALYADGEQEFWSGDDLAELYDAESWTPEPEPPEQVRVALEFLCCWRALPAEGLPAIAGAT